MSDETAAPDGTAEAEPDVGLPVDRPLPELSWSVGAIAERLGLSASTLRSWERRYGLGPTHRTHGNHRRYGPADVQRVELMARLTAQGVPAQSAAESVVPLGDAAVAARLASVEPDEVTADDADDARRVSASDVPEPSFSAEALVDGIIAAAGHLDAGSLVAYIRQALRQLDLREAWTTVFAPALRRVGDGWSDGSLGVESEHLVSELLQTELRAVVRAGRPRLSGPPVLLGSADDEQHHLPVIAVEAELARCGIPSVFLGPRVPARSMVEAVVHSQAPAVFLWASMNRFDDDAWWHAIARTGQPLLVVLGGPGWPDEAPDAGASVRVRRAEDLGAAVDLLLGERADGPA